MPLKVKLVINFVNLYLPLVLTGGFSRVFSLENLYLFSAEELQLLLCGDQAPSWSREDLLRYTEPKNGYTKDSPGYQMFVDVAAEMNPDERKVIFFIYEVIIIIIIFGLVEFYSFCDWKLVFTSRWSGKLAP